MPLYHFRVRNNGSEPEDEGLVLADFTAARTTALKFAGEILAFGPSVESDDWRVEVTNDQGLVLFTIHTILTESAAVVRGKR